MYFFFKSSCVYLSVIFIALFVVSNVAVVSVKFVKRYTGFNPLLNSFEMQSTITRSRAECGSLCEEKDCKSFIFQDTQKWCTLYSVYMTRDEGDILDQYYARSDAEEYQLEEVEPCSSRDIPNTSTNVALRKNVVMSSQYNQDTPSSLMVDGDLRSTWPCAHTHLETYPHATVDLLQSYEINAIYIVNRMDICCAERLHHLVVKIGDDMSSLETAFNHTDVLGADCTVIFDTPRRGRYVMLQIEATEYLTVCELEVYSIV